MLQILRCQSRSEAGVEGLEENRDDLFSALALSLRLDERPRAAWITEFCQQLPELSFAEARLLGGLPLRNELFVGFVQYHQPVALSLCHP